MIDFKEIAAKSSLYNFHSHTQFCDGRAPMEDFAAKAVELGFTDYGFSPHSPIPAPSSCNMSKDDTISYFKEIDRLRSMYRGKINLFASMEIDYLDESWGPANPYFDTLPLDYRIGSIHFVPCGDQYVDTDGSFDSFKIKMNRFFNEDIHYVVELFYLQTYKMIEAGKFKIIGHFDKIGHNASLYCPGIENEDWYNDLVVKTIKTIKEAGLIVEINTKSYDTHHRLFPHERYFPLLKKYEIPVVFNSDAHYPDLINAGREAAMKLYYSL